MPSRGFDFILHMVQDLDQENKETERTKAWSIRVSLKHQQQGKES